MAAARAGCLLLSWLLAPRGSGRLHWHTELQVAGRIMPIHFISGRQLVAATELKLSHYTWLQKALLDICHNSAKHVVFPTKSLGVFYRFIYVL
jgi:hypothetical protein